MTYKEAKAFRDILESVVKAASKTLNTFPRNGSMNLVTDAVRISPEYRASKAAYTQAFSDLRSFNTSFTKNFSKEIRLDRSK
jgi:hypothetical protein